MLMSSMEPMGIAIFVAIDKLSLVLVAGERDPVVPAFHLVWRMALAR
jgi:hypothetical protein